MAQSNVKLVPDKPDLKLLSEIALGKVRYIGKTAGAEVLLMAELININLHEPDPVDNSKVAVRITPTGAALLTANQNGKNGTNQNPVNEVKKTMFEVFESVELPPVKRGGGGNGAPTKYPFDQLVVGGGFFVPVTDKMPNPLKTLGSVISNAQHRYATQTGEKTVERSKRGKKNKLVLDENGHKIMEAKTVPIYEFTRKFTIRAVVSGETRKVNGKSWIAPADGVLIGRVQ